MTTLFLAGDVMTGRGVDQILAHPSVPDLHEPYVHDAREYVRLAEDANGPVPRSVEPAYIWGHVLDECSQIAPAARIVNLETGVTRSNDFDRSKSIHYRMNPENVGCLVAAHLDICVLANNHVLDFGPRGLIETLDTLDRAGIRTVGAGRDDEAAARPVVHALPSGQHLRVSAHAHRDSGVPDHWSAGKHNPGVSLLADLSDATAAATAAAVARQKLPGDIAVVSLHWGDNWGYDVSPEQVRFARRLVEEGVDIVYGHSSHHVRPIEIYRGRLILYGCGDFIDDYEGIHGHDSYRDDLALMYFPFLEAASGRLVELRMTPGQIRHLRLNRTSAEDAAWLCATLNRVSGAFGTRVEQRPDNTLVVRG